MYAKIINLGDKCNNNCYFCFNKNKAFETVFSKLRLAVKEGRKQNCEQVVFTGQEPTLYPKLYDLICLAKKLDYKVIQVVSNGRLFAYKDYAKKLIDAGMTELLVPIFSHLGIIHDRITQTPGSFKQAIKGILHVMDISKQVWPYKSVNITVGIVVCKENYKHLLNVTEFLAGLGIEQIFYIKDKKFDKMYYRSIKEDLIKNLQKTVKYLKRNDIACAVQGFTESESGDLKKIRYENIKKSNKIIKPVS